MPITPAVADAFIADEHDDPACECGACVRTRAREQASGRMRDAQLNGGLSAFGYRVLGPSWLDETGGKVETIEQLAQRALGDVFETIGKACEVGRTKCRGSQYGFVDNPPPIPRAEIKALLDYVDGLGQYALSQLAYLPSPRFAHNDRVLVKCGEMAEASDEIVMRELPGTVLGSTTEGRVRVRLDVGSTVDAYERDIIGAAQ